MTLNNSQNSKLRIILQEAKLRHTRKMGAIAATGAIVLAAESLTDHKDMQDSFSSLEGFLSPYNLSAHHYFAGTMLFNLITEVELYFTETIKAILVAYPKKLGSTQFKLSEIVQKPQEEVVLMAAERHLNSLMYKKPNEYLSELCEIMSIESAGVKPHWPPFIEAKARRDLGIHNNWIVNETYIRKMADSGIETTASKGSMLCPDHSYVQIAFDECDNLIRLIADLVDRKFSGEVGGV
jgi:hypothetical protein